MSSSSREMTVEIESDQETDQIGDLDPTDFSDDTQIQYHRPPGDYVRDGGRWIKERGRDVYIRYWRRKGSNEQ